MIFLILTVSIITCSQAIGRCYNCSGYKCALMNQDAPFITEECPTQHMVCVTFLNDFERDGITTVYPGRGCANSCESILATGGKRNCKSCNINNCNGYYVDYTTKN